MESSFHSWRHGVSVSARSLLSPSIHAFPPSAFVFLFCCCSPCPSHLFRPSSSPRRDWRPSAITLFAYLQLVGAQVTRAEPSQAKNYRPIEERRNQASRQSERERDKEKNREWLSVDKSSSPWQPPPHLAGRRHKISNFTCAPDQRDDDRQEKWIYSGLWKPISISSNDDDDVKYQNISILFISTTRANWINPIYYHRLINFDCQNRWDVHHRSADIH